jgi:acetyltransferase-like isoleucine patch superfamily enzyme
MLNFILKNKNICLKVIKNPHIIWYVRGLFFVILNNYKFSKISFPLKIYNNVSILNKKNIKFGRNITLAHNCYLSPISLTVGDDCWLGVNNFICGKVQIGNDVHLGPNVSIPGASHNIDSNNSISKSGSEFKGTIIKDYAWISSNVTIADGVTIGKGAVISANSFVNKDVQDFTVVGGVPAKFLKMRPKIEN